MNDTTFLGTHKFKNAYYGRNDEGVVIQLQSQISSKLKDVYSREMLISSIILKPHGMKGEDVIITPGDAPATEAKMRKGTMLTNSNKRTLTPDTAPLRHEDLLFLKISFS